MSTVGNKYRDKGSSESGTSRGIDQVSSIELAVVTLVSIAVIVVVLFPYEPDTIVIRSVDAETDFNAVSALAYADRVSRIAELTVGGVMTLALALVAFNWASNNARIQNDREDLANHKEDLEGQVLNRLTEMESEVMARLDDYRATGNTLTKNMDALRNDLESRIDERSKAILRDLQHQQNLFEVEHLRASAREAGPLERFS